MNLRQLVVILCVELFGGTLFAQEVNKAKEESAAGEIPTPSTQQVTLADGVKLEVVDWGGTGRSLILLAGLGGTVHAFDKFAPKLTPYYHVYGITRRGFGTSTVAASGYSADELGDDVLAVMNHLKLEKPVLVGHSFAGEELSSVATRYPDKVAGLVYLDAAYGYAYYDATRGDITIDANEVRTRLNRLGPGVEPSEQRPLIDGLLHYLPLLENDLRARQRTLPPAPRTTSAQKPKPTPELPAPVRAALAGQKKFTAIPVPILAIYAVPHDLSGSFKDDPEGQAKAEADDAIETEAKAKAFETGVPTARVVRIAHASHAIFRSNEEEVLREMHAFIDRLQ